jgi:hypothetical protein
VRDERADDCEAEIHQVIIEKLLSQRTADGSDEAGLVVENGQTQLVSS